MLRFLIATVIFIVGQLAAWFQSNAGILGGKLEENYILLAIILGPVVSVSFAIATKMMYHEVGSLWYRLPYIYSSYLVFLRGRILNRKKYYFVLFVSGSNTYTIFNEII